MGKGFATAGVDDIADGFPTEIEDDVEVEPVTVRVMARPVIHDGVEVLIDDGGELVFL